MTEEMTSHGLTLNRREKINATGITDVISFDEENIVAQTTLGVLIIRGDKLHINSLNLEKGTLNVDGNILPLCMMTMKVCRKTLSLLNFLSRCLYDTINEFSNSVSLCRLFLRYSWGFCL